MQCRMLFFRGNFCFLIISLFFITSEFCFCQVVLDIDDYKKIPFYDILHKRINQEAVRLRYVFVDSCLYTDLISSYHAALYELIFHW